MAKQKPSSLFNPSFLTLKVNPMRAVLLAAGKGQRLSPLTDDRHKCLLKIAGKTLLDWQLEAYKHFGVRDVSIVKGYLGSLIKHRFYHEYWNHDYEKTNMVASLFCAEAELHGDLIVSYADIVFERRILRALIDTPEHDVIVPIDIDWKRYYTKRFGSPLTEAESLITDSSGRIIRIGDETSDLGDIQGRFIGLLKLSEAGSAAFRQLFHKELPLFWDKPWMRGRSLKMAYMTDFLQALIDQGTPVFSLPVKGGWLEMDSVDDYTKALEWHADGSLAEIFSFER